jgi:hypothetical protein
VIGARIPWRYQTGGVSALTPWFAWLLAAMVFVGPFLLLCVYGRWWTLPFLLLSGGVLAGLTWSSLRLGAWDRRQRRPERTRDVRA